MALPLIPLAAAGAGLIVGYTARVIQETYFGEIPVEESPKRAQKKKKKSNGSKKASAKSKSKSKSGPTPKVDAPVPAVTAKKGTPLPKAQSKRAEAPAFKKTLGDQLREKFPKGIEASPQSAEAGA